MTVSEIDRGKPASAVKSDGRRPWLGAPALVSGARHAIQVYGHHADDFGSTATGFSLEGAVYAAARLYDGVRLHDPYRCAAHRPQRGAEPRVCEPGCEDPLWRQCSLAFSYIAEGLRTAHDEPMRLTGVRACPRDFGEVANANYRLTKPGALFVLSRVSMALDKMQQPSRVLAGAA